MRQLDKESFRATSKHIIGLSVVVIIASVALYVGIALYVLPTGEVHYHLWDWLFPMILILVAVALDLLVARLWNRITQRHFPRALFWTVSATLLGALLTSIAVMRENWFEIMKEVFSSHMK